LRSSLAVRTALQCCMLEKLPEGEDSIRLHAEELPGSEDSSSAVCMRNNLAVRTALGVNA
jgi:hypothetical protein